MVLLYYYHQSFLIFIQSIMEGLSQVYKRMGRYEIVMV